LLLGARLRAVHIAVSPTFSCMRAGYQRRMQILGGLVASALGTGDIFELNFLGTLALPGAMP